MTKKDANEKKERNAVTKLAQLKTTCTMQQIWTN
jgi:hypothetical protein